MIRFNDSVCFVEASLCIEDAQSDISIGNDISLLIGHYIEKIAEVLKETPVWNADLVLTLRWIRGIFYSPEGNGRLLKNGATKRVYLRLPLFYKVRFLPMT